MAFTYNVNVREIHIQIRQKSHTEGIFLRAGAHIISGETIVQLPADHHLRTHVINVGGALFAPSQKEKDVSYGTKSVKRRLH